jgi:ABC-type sugar transport system ATPase subunit
MTLADRIVVLRDGMIEQIGAPADLYERPVNRFVASFIGSPRMNFLTGRVISIRAGAIEVQVPDLDPAAMLLPTIAETGLGPGDVVEIGIRPDDLRVDGGGPARLKMQVELCEYIGGATYLHAPNHPAGRLTVRHVGAQPTIGTIFNLGLSLSSCHVFSKEGRMVSRATTE